MRNDTGQLWENFLVSERLKFIHYTRSFVNRYFWRSYRQKEVDYIEEKTTICSLMSSSGVRNNHVSLLNSATHTLYSGSIRSAGKITWTLLPDPSKNHLPSAETLAGRILASVLRTL
jgi:hypothetical protein